MSVIVKGMDMPENCGKCFVGNREICVNGCPLVPVQEGRVRKAVTNADRIRSMTDEELAKWFGKIQYDTAYFCAGEDKQKYPYPDGWLDWLKEEKADEL